MKRIIRDLEYRCKQVKLARTYSVLQAIYNGLGEKRKDFILKRSSTIPVFTSDKDHSCSFEVEQLHSTTGSGPTAVPTDRTVGTTINKNMLRD